MFPSPCEIVDYRRWRAVTLKLAIDCQHVPVSFSVTGSGRFGAGRGQMRREAIVYEHHLPAGSFAAHGTAAHLVNTRAKLTGLARSHGMDLYQT